MTSLSKQFDASIDGGHARSDGSKSIDEGGKIAGDIFQGRNVRFDRLNEILCDRFGNNCGSNLLGGFIELVEDVPKRFGNVRDAEMKTVCKQSLSMIGIRKCRNWVQNGCHNLEDRMLVIGRVGTRGWREIELVDKVVQRDDKIRR